MPETITCGEATMRLLAKYEVDTVFGIPGVHTLDFCRGLAESPINHVQARNEQGAGFMADGYARVSGRPGVALVISGPGVTNALTAIGQAWADSIPVLLLSAETATNTHGKGWGALHEIPDQQKVTRPLTAFAERADKPQDVPGLVARAFEVFASERPRPVHISIPIDVQAMPVSEEWEPVAPPQRPRQIRDADISKAAGLLKGAKRPVILVGGGATGAAAEVRKLAETLNAPVVASTAGKGVVADDHPLSLSGSTVRPEIQQFLGTTDVALAIGTELAETDSFVDELDLPDELVRIDIDPSKIDDMYPAAVGIVSDAKPATAALADALSGFQSQIDVRSVEREMDGLRSTVRANLTDSERRHEVLLDVLRDAVADDSLIMGDICQLVYTGAFAYDARQPRTWHYPAGFCTLGCGLPNAVGAKLAMPDRDVVCLAGDGGVMFTIQELMTASELRLPIPVVIWDNGGLKQIQDDMKSRDIDLVGVSGPNPDFVTLAESMGCHGVEIEDAAHFRTELERAFASDRPSIMTVREGEGWLA